MRHRKQKGKLSRDAAHRKALFSNLCREVIDHERIQTVGDLVQKSDSELAAIPNFGRKSIEEVKETLDARGLGLRAG